jgi:hypothetical protein
MDRPGKLARVLPRDPLDPLGAAVHTFATGGDGKVYYSNLLDNTIRRIDLLTGQTELIHVVWGNFDGNIGPIAFGPDGNLYVGAGGPRSDGDSGIVKRLDGSSFADLGWVARTYASRMLHWNSLSGDYFEMNWGAPLGIAFGPSDGLLYISGTGDTVAYVASAQDAPAVTSLGGTSDIVAGHIVGWVRDYFGYGGPILFDRSRTQSGETVAVSPTPTTSLTFDTVETAGVTTVTPLGAVSTEPEAILPPNFELASATGGIASYFDIHTTATFSGPVTLTVAYDQMQFPWNPDTNPTAKKPALLHYDNGQWVDITSSIDVVKGTISGLTSSFSPFAIVKKHVFTWSDVLQPVNADGTSSFKQGSTIPVKFQLTGADAGIRNLIGKLYLSQLDSVDPVSANEAVSTATADSGNTFRYDATAGQYIFNLSTKSLSQGTWYLRIDLGDGTSNVVKLRIKK